MNYLLDNPNEIDYYFEKLQTRWFNYALDRWNISSDNYISLGRVYRLNTDNGFAPLAYTGGKYIGSSGDGKGNDLFFEKGKAVSFFHLLETKKQANGDYRATGEFYFFLDTTVITPGGITSTTQRLDRIAIQDVENFVTNNGCGWVVKDVIGETDKILEKFSGPTKKMAMGQNIQGDNNTYPSFMAFKLTIENNYNPVLFSTPQQNQLQPMQMSLEITISASPNRTTAKTYVGNGKYVWNEYAEGNTLTPIYTDGSPFLAGKNVQLPFVLNDTNISLPDFNLSTGTWTKTGLPYGFNATDFIIINLTNYS